MDSLSYVYCVFVAFLYDNFFRIAGAFLVSVSSYTLVRVAGAHLYFTLKAAALHERADRTLAHSVVAARVVFASTLIMLLTYIYGAWEYYDCCC